jgi:hypothetical protein
MSRPTARCCWNKDSTDAALNKLLECYDLLHNFVNGDEAAVVTMNGVPTPTLRGVVREMEAHTRELLLRLSDKIREAGGLPEYIHLAETETLAHGYSAGHSGVLAVWPETTSTG